MYKAVIVTAVVGLSGCAPTESKVGMANPASTYCVDIGGSVSIQNTGGGDIGICTLPDGSTIEEWELFRRDNPQR
ncbi:MAG: putative hemolysin [Paenalcaligenes sp.]